MPKTYGPLEKKELIEQALELRYEGKLNWEQVADRLEVARSTLSEWRKSSEWRELDAVRRRLLRDEARSGSASMLNEMTDVLYELAKTARSEYVRFTAASKLIDLNSVGMEIEEAAVDQAKELNEFLGRLGRKRDRMVDYSQIHVLPGGLLPPEVDERNIEYRDRKRQETETLEAEYRELEDG